MFKARILLGKGTRSVGRVRGVAGAARPVRVGAPDASLTAVSGLAAVAELVARLGVVASVDRHVGAVKRRARGLSAGEFLVQLASAQPLGEDVFAGFDRLRDDAGAGLLGPAPLPAST